MATKQHNQMTGADLHPNKIDATTGTELTTPSETIYDNRWAKLTGATFTGPLSTTGVLSTYNKLQGTQNANVLDIQPGTNSYTRMLDKSGNLLATFSAGEGSTIAGYKPNGTTYILSMYTSTDASVLGFRVDGSGNVDAGGNKVRIRNSKTPVSATDTGNAGEICWDSSYIYGDC